MTTHRLEYGSVISARVCGIHFSLHKLPNFMVVVEVEGQSKVKILKVEIIYKYNFENFSPVLNWNSRHCFEFLLDM